MDKWEPSPQELRAFRGWKATFERIRGPHTLWRFSSRPDLENDPSKASWWTDKTTVVAAARLSYGATHAGMVFEHLRQGLALREDWGNTLLYAFELDIPEGGSVAAWVGESAAQQAHVKAGRLSERAEQGLPLILAGGTRQYLLRHADRAVRWMIGPAIGTRREPH